jgi:molybdopterin converting factor small subunit
MTINLRLLGYYQLITGTLYLKPELPEDSTLEDLWSFLVKRYRQLESDDMKSIAGMTVNGTYVNRKDWADYIPKDNDSIDLISQMAGG